MLTGTNPNSGSPAYKLRLTCKTVPDALEGVPLPVEVLTPTGETRLTTMSGWGDTAVMDVNAPGRYTARVELPTGQWLTATTTISDAANTADATGDLVFDFTANTATLATSPTKRRISLLSHTATANTLRLLSQDAHSHFVGLQSRPNETAMATASEHAMLDYGFFNRWESDLRLTGTAENSDVFMDFPDTFTLSEHPGARAYDSTRWRPLLVRVTLDAPQDGATENRVEALVVWPPVRNAARLLLLSDPTPSDAPDAPPVLASAAQEDRFSAAFFGYLRSDSPDRARQIGDAWSDYAVNLLDEKRQDPVAATLGAYVLLRIGNDKHSRWTYNLANWFRYLPDGAVLYGWSLIRAGRAGEAVAAFHTALNRGIPMFTEGVRLLYDGLNHLRGLYPQNKEVATDAARAYRLFALMNPDSELTCLRLTPGILELEFVNERIGQVDFIEVPAQVRASEEGEAEYETEYAAEPETE